MRAIAFPLLLLILAMLRPSGAPAADPSSPSVMPIVDPIRAMEILSRPASAGAVPSPALTLMAVAGLAIEGDPLRDGVDRRWAALARSLIKPLGTTEDQVAAWWWMAYEGRNAEVAAALAKAAPAVRARIDAVWLDRFIRRDWREVPDSRDPEAVWMAWLRCAVTGSAPVSRLLARVPAATLARYPAQNLILGCSTFTAAESAGTLEAAEREASAFLVWSGRTAPATGVALHRALGALASTAAEGSPLRLRCISLQSRLRTAAYRRHAFIAYSLHDPEGAERMAAPWIQEAPQGLLALLMSGGSARRNKSFADRLAAGSERSLGDPADTEPLFLQAEAWRRLAEAGHGKAKLLRDPLIRAWRAAIPDGGSAGAGILMECMDPSSDRAPACLKDAAKADPWAALLHARLVGGDAGRLGKRLDQLMTKEPWHLAAIAAVLAEMDLQSPTPAVLPALEHIRSLEPQHPALYSRGFVLKTLGRPDEAVSAHLEYLRNSEEFATVLVRMELSRHYESRGDLVAAERFAREAAGTGKQDAMTAYAEFLGRRERWEEARGWWERSADRYDDADARICALAAGLQVGGAKAEEARAALATITYPQQEAYEKVRWAAYLVEGFSADGRMEEAIRLARAIDRESGSPIARRQRIRLALATGSIAEAEDLLIPVLQDAMAQNNQSASSAMELLALADAVAAVTGRDLRVSQGFHGIASATAAAVRSDQLTAYVDGWKALRSEGPAGARRRWEAVSIGPSPRWRACARASLAALAAPTPSLARCLARMGPGSESP